MAVEGESLWLWGAPSLASFLQLKRLSPQPCMPRYPPRPHVESLDESSYVPHVYSIAKDQNDLLSNG